MKDDLRTEIKDCLSYFMNGQVDTLLELDVAGTRPHEALDRLEALFTRHCHKKVLEGRIDELENFKPLFKYSHENCPDPKTCVGYQNAESDFDNEKELRLTKLRKELRDADNSKS